MVVHTCTKNLNIQRHTKKKSLQESLILLPLVITFLIFIDMDMQILTAKSNFGTFWKENYAIGLDSCYLFNVAHGTEHDIDSAWGVCMY